MSDYSNNNDETQPMHIYPYSEDTVVNGPPPPPPVWNTQTGLHTGGNPPQQKNSRSGILFASALFGAAIAIVVYLLLSHMNDFGQYFNVTAAQPTANIVTATPMPTSTPTVIPTSAPTVSPTQVSGGNNPPPGYTAYFSQDGIWEIYQPQNAAVTTDQIDFSNETDSIIAFSLTQNEQMFVSINSSNTLSDQDIFDAFLQYQNADMSTLQIIQSPVQVTAGNNSWVEFSFLYNVQGNDSRMKGVIYTTQFSNGSVILVETAPRTKFAIINSKYFTTMLNSFTVLSQNN